MTLEGRTIGITADRRGEDQAVMFRRLGAEVLLAPTLRTLKEAPDGLREQTEQLIDRPPDYLIANTGFGMRLWFEHAAGWGVDDALRQALGQTRLVARGPKAAGALSSNGLSASWRAASEQLTEVADHLVSEGVAGKRVAFQLQGRDTPEITTRLEAAGATVSTIPVYRWTKPEAGSRVADLIEKCCEGQIDAITFTAAPQVRYLMEMADSAGSAGALIDALNDGIVVGCIGPVCASAAQQEGIRDPVVPDNWRLGSLVKAVAEALG
jgi:uroporphyrinogen-III synthase